MKILYLIGNGFDIGLTLETRYNQFYDFILKEKDEKESTIVSKFKNEIYTQPENWSDLEFELGKFTDKIDTSEDANILHDYLIEKLSEYLSKIENSWSIEKSEKEKFIGYLLKPTENRLLPVENEEIISFRNNWSRSSPWYTQVITFNYTKSIEKIMENEINNLILGSFFKDIPVKLNKIEHIHGYTQERMILGVNDISQLANDDFLNNTETTDRYIKSDCNSTYGLGHEKKCLEMVNSANLIIIFGMSYGDTDKNWWNAIGDRLLNGSLVVLFEYDEKAKFNNNQGAQKKAHKEKVKKYFLSKTKIPQDKIDEVKKRVYVALNTDMFNINIIKEPGSKSIQTKTKAKILEMAPQSN